VYITEEQFFMKDVQNAIKKGSIVISGPSPKPLKMKIVTNITTGSLILPGYGALKKDSSIEIRVEDLKHPDIDRLFIGGKLVMKDGKVGKKAKKSAKDEQEELPEQISPVDQKMNAIAHKPKYELDIKTDKKDNKKKGLGVKRVTDNDLLDIENGTVPGEKDGIQFVDIEQNEERISQHPNLRKLKGQ
jgi:adenine deaminase